MKDLTRETLDRLAIHGGGRVALACIKHADSGTTAIYQDGALRILCRHCGFEAARIKVASAASPRKAAADQVRKELEG